jgi:hypothetical protein
VLWQPQAGSVRSEHCRGDVPRTGTFLQGQRVARTNQSVRCAYAMPTTGLVCLACAFGIGLLTMAPHGASSVPAACRLRNVNDANQGGQLRVKTWCVSGRDRCRLYVPCTIVLEGV